MERATITRLLFAAIILTRCLVSQSQWDPHHHPLAPVEPKPLCIQQYTIVNHACGILPYERRPNPNPPPAPPSPDDPDNEGRRSSGQRHHHGNGEHGEESQEEYCCRWLKQVDDVCVCDLLVRLPPFLTRPVHNYTVLVGEVCEVSFLCASRMVK